MLVIGASRWETMYKQHKKASPFKPEKEKKFDKFTCFQQNIHNFSQVSADFFVREPRIIDFLLDFIEKSKF